MSVLDIVTEKMKNDPLAMTIHNVIRVMRLDYALAFGKAFPQDEDVLNFRRRLYIRIKAMHTNPNVLVDAYEALIEKNPSFMPNGNELIEEVKAVIKARLRHAEQQAEVARLAALPAPTIECNPLLMLSKAKAAAKANSKEDHAAWMKRKEEAMNNHNAVISLHSSNIRKKYAQQWHSCKVDGCRKPGSISSGTSGGDNFYCHEHFLMKI
jgi:hypothetical protein